MDTDCMLEQDKENSKVSSFQLPAKPQALADLQLEKAKPEPSIQAFADIISKDVALSSSVLKIINSPAFGLKRTVTDIKQSVIMLGYNNVTNIVSFFQLRNSFQDRAAISLEKFWDTAMETANMISLTLENLNYKFSCTAEDAYAFGLFRDCGIPLLAVKYPNYKEVLIEANSKPEQIFTAIEESYYQTDHAAVGYFMARSWNLPKQLCDLIQDHHKQDYLVSNLGEQSQKDIYALTKIASNVLNHYKFMKDDSEWLLAKDSVLEYFSLSEPDYQDLEDDLKDAFDIHYT